MTSMFEQIPEEIILAISAQMTTQKELPIYGPLSVRDEIIKRIDQMTTNHIFGFSAYFNHDDEVHRRAERLVASYYGMDIYPHNSRVSLLGGAVILQRSIQLEPVSININPVETMPAHIIGVYYDLLDPTNL